MNNNYNNRNNGGRGNHPQNEQKNQHYGVPYPPVRHVSRRQAKKAAAVAVLGVIIVVMLLISVIIFASRCASGAITGNDTESDAISEYDGTTTSDDTSGEDTFDDTTADTEPKLDPNYHYITKTAADIHKGHQILVNYDYAFDFSTAPKMSTLFANKNGVFKVSNTSDSLENTALSAFVDMMKAFSLETGNSDIIVTSSDRSLDTQKSIWDSRVNTYGEEYARLYVAEPGHSEHHSGLALDLAIYDDEGNSYKFDEKPEYAQWLTANAHRFGFVERYKADKTDITKIAYENWHYRYVGIPHAYYMLENNLCLEEYIEYLSSIKFGEKSLLIMSDEGEAWEVYFVPAAAEGDTEIPVPVSGDYEVSGNNVDGFIITVKK